MKQLSIALLLLSFPWVPEAVAQSCTDRAALCVQRGGTQGNCYNSNRLASCEATGQYVAPNGNTYPATKSKK